MFKNIWNWIVSKFKPTKPEIEPAVINFIKTEAVNAVQSSQGQRTEDLLIGLVKQQVQVKYGTFLAELSTAIIRAEITSLLNAAKK